MTEPQRPRNLPRSICAVIAGMLAGAVLSIATDIALRRAGVFPPLGQVMDNGLLLVATSYRTVYSVAASYLAARLAPSRPMTHALALGVVGFVVCILGAVATWNRGPEFGPHWYPLALVVLALPSAWAGGVLHRMLHNQ